MKESLGVITIEDIKKYAYWFAAYFPVIALLLYKYLKDNFLSEGLNINITKSFTFDISNDIFVFIILSVFTIIIYKICNKLYITKAKMEIEKNALELSVKKFEQVSLNAYSFFILSLLLPFISQNSTETLELLVNLTLIFIIIRVLVKKDQMITNPVFLFTRNNIFKAIVDIDDSIKEVYIITSEQQLGSDENFYYSKYFSIYYIEKKTEKEL